MSKFQDLTGMKFGRLTVLGLGEPYINKQGYKTTRWDCLCVCGNRTLVRTSHLKNGNIQSCGCLGKERLQEYHEECFKDLTGMRFGRLIVLNRAEDYINPQGIPLVRWNCICDCGNKHITYGASLKSGLTQSCGCLQKEAARTNGQSCKKSNKYDLTGEYGIGYSDKGEEFWFDLEDYEKLKSYYWRINNHGYVNTYDNNYNDMYMLHNIIMEPNAGFIVDHINHNTLDNRKKNLRLVTYSQNQMNLRLKSNNKSGVTGVYWDDTYGHWVAKITKNYNTIILGKFNNFEEAVIARKAAEEKYFGEYSYDNSMKIGERNG